jgi:hypothetical protein
MAAAHTLYSAAIGMLPYLLCHCTSFACSTTVRATAAAAATVATASVNFASYSSDTV